MLIPAFEADIIYCYHLLLVSNSQERRQRIPPSLSVFAGQDSVILPLYQLSHAGWRELTRRLMRRWHHATKRLHRKHHDRFYHDALSAAASDSPVAISGFCSALLPSEATSPLLPSKIIFCPTISVIDLAWFSLST